ncbi:MAG: hypothetical protein QOC97_758 [Chloroflexota bacterium]|nr:hypothetical protein [Chloroflexota bacterium]
MTSRSGPTRLRLFVMAGAIAAVMALAPVASASVSAGLSFAKMCTPDVCTVQDSSNPSLIPDGSTLTYFGPRFDPHLSSGFVLATSGGTATGHCSLSWATGTGHCIIAGGTGSLAGFHAVLSEWVDFGNGEFETFVFHLDGAYHVD